MYCRWWIEEEDISDTAFTEAYSEPYETPKKESFSEIC